MRIETRIYELFYQQVFHSDFKQAYWFPPYVYVQGVFFQIPCGKLK